MVNLILCSPFIQKLYVNIWIDRKICVLNCCNMAFIAHGISFALWFCLWSATKKQLSQRIHMIGFRLRRDSLLLNLWQRRQDYKAEDSCHCRLDQGFSGTIDANQGTRPGDPIGHKVRASRQWASRAFRYQNQNFCTRIFTGIRWELLQAEHLYLYDVEEVRAKFI